MREIDRCRICGNPALDPVLNLGSQALTGVFSKRITDSVPYGPLELVRCRWPGCGASTKGNVVLQFRSITSDLLPFIAEVNPDKFGAYTLAC